MNDALNKFKAGPVPQDHPCRQHDPPPARP